MNESIGNFSSSTIVQVAHYYTPTSNPYEFWLYICITVGLVLTAGLMAGLTTGLLSLDFLNMQILCLEGSVKQKKYAKKVLPVISKHHFLLVTLMLVNAAANEALPIFLNKLVSETTAIMLSVSCVLVFGEILPSAIFTGPSQLAISAFMIPFVKMLMFLSSPISYPISRLLDNILGQNHAITKYRRKELKALITLHTEHVEAKRHYKATMSPENDLGKSPSLISQRGCTQGNVLQVDEVTVIHGALDLATKSLQNIMIPMKDVHMLEASTKLSENVLVDIMASGHSRIPVYKGNPSNIIGILLVKRLIVLDPEDERQISEIHLRRPILAHPHASCYSLLNEFQKGRCHIALLTHDVAAVRDCWDKGIDIEPDKCKFIGIVTIEDVLEELIQEEIEDESDNVYHSRCKIRESGLRIAATKFKILAQRAKRRIQRRHEQENQLSIKIASERDPLLP